MKLLKKLIMCIIAIVINITIPIVAKADYPKEATLSEADTVGQDRSPSFARKKTVNRRCYSVLAVDEQPMFPGGSDSLSQWITDNLRYPDNIKCKKNKIIGVLAIIGCDGHVFLPEYEKERIDGIKDYSSEIYRIFELMPMWIPGKVDGQAVDVYHTFNFHFTPQ